MHRPILLAISFIALAGCGGTPANQAAPAPGQAAAPGAPPAPDQPPAQISIATPEGRAEIRTGAGAAPYPDGLPQYPGASADQSVNVSGASARGSGRILGFRTADPAAQVVAFYADAATRAGYRIVNRAETGANATLIVQPATGEPISISAVRLGDYTQAQIIVAGR